MEAHSGTAGDHFEIGSEAHSGKKEAHSGTVENYCGMEEDRSGIEEAVHSETEVESRARLVGGIAEAAQILDFEVEQKSAVAEKMETAIVEKGVVAERKVEEKQNRTSFEADLQMAFAAAAAAEDSLASRPCRHILV